MAFRTILPAAVFLASALFAAEAWAGTKTWVGGNGSNNTQRTDWARSGNWNPSGAPNFNDLAIIPVTTFQPTVRADQNLGQLQVANGAVLTINTGFTLTCDGTATGGVLSSPVLQGPGTVAGAGTVRITGGLNNGLAISTSMTLPNLTFALSLPFNVFGIASGVTVTVNGALTVSSGSLQVGDAGGAASTLDVNGNLTMSATMGMRAANSILRLSGNLNFSGNANNWTPGTSTVILDNTANMTMTFSNANYQFNNLTIATDAGGQQINGDLVTPNNGFTVNGNLAITQGQFQIGLFTVTVNGNVTSGASGVSQLDFTNTGVFRCRGNVDLGSVSQITTAVNGPFATILLDGTTSVQTFQLHAATNTAYFDLDQFQVSNPLGVIVLDNPNADFTVNGQLTIDAGCSLTVRDVFDPESPLVMGANSTLRLENLVSADSTLVGSLFSLGAGSTVVYGAPAPINQLVYTQQANGTQIPYQNLTIDNSGGSVATEQNVNTLNVLGNFTILGAASNFVGTANGMTVAKNFVDNGTFTHGGGTVTMTGTGSITGTAASLVFNNLTVNGGATTDVVTAARSFTTNNLLQVFNGSLTTSGAITPITMTALQNVTVGNAAGAAGTASLNLRGTDTLAVAATRTFSVNATDGRFTSLGNGPPYTNGPAGNPTLTRNGGAGNFITDIGGQVNLMGLNFSFGGANGMYLHNATVQRLRNVRFTSILAGAGSRHLTLDSAVAQDVDCPGCMFDTVTAPVSGVPTQFNVWAQGAAHRLRFEQRTASNAAGAIGGPGAGEAFDGDDDTNDDGRIAGSETVTTHNGAIIQWVYTANIDMTGAIQGFPAVAFNWNTFAYASTYMIMRQASGVGDIIYVANANGDLKGYSYALGNLVGNITGPLFWDTEGVSTQVLYFGTTTGLVYKLIDTGSALITPGFPWDTVYSDPGLKYVSTTIMSDRTNLYFGGSDNLNPAVGNWGMYRVVSLTKAAPGGPISLNGAAITNASSWADTLGGRMIFQASGTASGTSAIYRILTSNWTIDAQVNSTSAFTAPTNVPSDTCFVGEANGRMHAVAALGPTGVFPERTAFPFTINASSVTGGAVWEPVNILRQPTLSGGRLLFGAANGDVYLLYLYPPNAAAWAAGTNYYVVSPAAGPVQSMPLMQDGLFYVSTGNGKLLVYDADNGAGPALMTTYNLFNPVSTTGDISRDAASGSGRIYIATSDGRMYAIPAPTDPTTTFP